MKQGLPHNILVSVVYTLIVVALRIGGLFVRAKKDA
jgi:hypothetical protein